MYPFFFFTLSGACFYQIWVSQGFYGILWLWPMISSLIMCFSYLFRKPDWVCGKRRDGRTSWIRIAFNLPWLLFTWLIWAFEAILSSEDPANKIDETNLFIGRYPRLLFPQMQFDLVIDLTAEFPRSWIEDGYICCPNLDGVSLTNVSIPLEINKGMKILVHCAQGHGRSATFMAILINKIYPEISKKEAYETVKRNRPKVRASSEQIKENLA